MTRWLFFCRAANGTTTINTSPVCEWWKDLHAWCEPECMTYLQSKPILQQQQQIPMSVSSGSPNSSSTSSAFSEDLLSKEVHCGIVDTMKLLQRGAKSINVTFNSIDKWVIQLNSISGNKTIRLFRGKWIYAEELFVSEPLDFLLPWPQVDTHA